VTAAIALNVVRKTGSDDGSCGYTVVALQCTGKFGDTRRTTVSAADAEDSGVSICLDFSP
jgi:hypothetical protein